MKLALLFFFYKDIDVCRNRLQLLKQYNPDSKIFGLYGGPKEEEDMFKEELKAYFDDFYSLAGLDGFWIWIHNDLSMLKWYEARGKDLEWDSVVICQWDMLAFESFEKVFAGIKKDEIYLPNFGRMKKAWEDSWYWTSKEHYEKALKEKPINLPYMRGNLLAFKKLIAEKYQYTKKPFIGMIMFGVIPRLYFEKFKTVEQKEIGFLEYKVPTYAKIFKIPVFNKYLGEYRLIPHKGFLNRIRNRFFNRTNRCSMNALKRPIRPHYIRQELKKKNGWRVFHPYFEVFDLKKK